MTSPTYELQGRIAALLKADPTLASLIKGRVYDSVPSAEGQVTAKFPYVSFGPSDELSDDADCIDGFEITMQIDVWSRAVGFPECRRIVDAVRKALPEDGILLADNALVTFNHRISRIFRDPDGKTSHGAMTFEAFVEQP
ncbi:DUF3168 domain-containing protein [Brucella intermedia GD04153]|uniref:DUF3168 domain-containing protein n=1 Tax=Brucella intermedia GD04153 TaxID=2975438 RepID=A0AA42H2L9_9HYPH|nr:DUF3168 domain-containing protein [Brucella intermedia]MDH0126677.1 DUF3168 domain-containing protein [Brucella intermedia GD04153]